MSDCLWSVTNSCSCTNMIECSYYISVNDKVGFKLLEEFENSISEAVIPVYKFWKNKFIDSRKNLESGEVV